MAEEEKMLNLLSDIKKQLDRIEEKIKTKPDTKGATGTNPKPKAGKTSSYMDKIEPKKLEHLNDLNSVHDQCLYLLNFISQKTNGEGGLTTDEMKKVLAEKFGLTTITIYNISMSMKKATGKYVTRTKFSDKTEKFQYQILSKGKQYIESKIKNLIKNT